MCLIIAKQAGQLPCKSTFFSGAKANPDAMGIAYFREDGQMAVHKWVDQKDRQIRRAWDIVKGLKDKPVLIHFRFTTHGANSFSNCHPFPLGRDAVMAHNGIIPGHYDKEKSDTALFVEKVVRPLYQEFGKEFLKESHSILHKEVGASKLATLNVEGEFHYVNEHMGEWEDGNWYSNSWHFPNKWGNTVSHYGKPYSKAARWNDAGFWEYNTDCNSSITRYSHGYSKDEGLKQDQDAEYLDWMRRNREPEVDITDVMDDFAYAYKWNMCGECGMYTDAHYCPDCRLWTTPTGMQANPGLSPAQAAVKAIQEMRAKA